MAVKRHPHPIETRVDGIPYILTFKIINMKILYYIWKNVYFCQFFFAPHTPCLIILSKT